MASSLTDADIITLGRFVCCYPNAEDPLRGAAQRARKFVALTYPQNRWYVRAFVSLANIWQRLLGSTFRAFVHAPDRMQAVLENGGFVRSARRGTAFWMFDLYRRDTAGAADRRWITGREARCQVRAVYIEGAPPSSRTI